MIIYQVNNGGAQKRESTCQGVELGKKTLHLGQQQELIVVLFSARFSNLLNGKPCCSGIVSQEALSYQCFHPRLKIDFLFAKDTSNLKRKLAVDVYLYPHG